MASHVPECRTAGLATTSRTSAPVTGSLYSGSRTHGARHLGLHVGKALPRVSGACAERWRPATTRFSDAVLSTGNGLRVSDNAGWRYANLSGNRTPTATSWTVGRHRAQGSEVGARTLQPRCRSSVGPNLVRDGSPSDRGGVPVGGAAGGGARRAHSGDAEPRDLAGGRLGTCRGRARRTASSCTIRTAESIVIDEWLLSSCKAASTARHTETATRRTRPARWQLDEGNLANASAAWAAPASIQVTIQGAHRTCRKVKMRAVTLHEWQTTLGFAGAIAGGH